MKRISQLFVLAFLAMLMLWSCDNELEINAEYRDINVVYGVLDPSKQRQYIRINRAFLTEDNAMVAATIADSSNYPYMLNVTVQEFNKNNQLVKTYTLLTDTLEKPGGVFSVGQQPFYYFESDQIFSINSYSELSSDTLYFDPENYFKLKIENPVTGDITEAETMLLTNFNVTKPAPYNKFVSFIFNNQAAVEMKSVPNGKVYQAKFIFYYRDVFVDNPTDTIINEIVWDLGTLKSERISGGEELYFSYIPYTFFNIVKQRIPDNPNVKRYHGKFTENGRVDVQLVITAGALELSAYMDANKPSGSIIQDKPLYTNVTNGIGIFSSKRMVTLNYYLNALTVDSLRNGSTEYLNFQ